MSSPHPYANPIASGASSHNTSAANSPNPFQSIITVHDHDVLSGRGVNIAQHPGNERFRALVQARHDADYCAEYTTPQKRAVAEDIIRHLKALNPPARFLKRSGRANSARGLEGPWEELTEREAIKKTCQALRDCNRQDRSGYAAQVYVPEDVKQDQELRSQLGLSNKEYAEQILARQRRGEAHEMQSLPLPLPQPLQPQPQAKRERDEPLEQGTSSPLTETPADWLENKKQRTTEPTSSISAATPMPRVTPGTATAASAFTLPSLSAFGQPDSSSHSHNNSMSGLLLGSSSIATPRQAVLPQQPPTPAVATAASAVASFPTATTHEAAVAPTLAGITSMPLLYPPLSLEPPPGGVATYPPPPAPASAPASAAFYPAPPPENLGPSATTTQTTTTNTNDLLNAFDEAVGALFAPAAPTGFEPASPSHERTHSQGLDSLSNLSNPENDEDDVERYNPFPPSGDLAEEDGHQEEPSFDD